MDDFIKVVFVEFILFYLFIGFFIFVILYLEILDIGGVILGYSISFIYLFKYMLGIDNFFFFCEV